MTKIVSVAEMRDIEKAADAGGLSYDRMMENAGEQVARAIVDRVPDLEGKRVAILAGPGNNGGDGLVAGRHLAEAGAQVSVYLVQPREQDDPHLSALRETGMLIAEADQDQRSRVLNNMLRAADVVIDAVFGTGLRLPLRDSARSVLQSAGKAIERKETPPLIVAVDCPSGLDCDTGEVDGSALRCTLTVTMAAAKTGMFRFPGADRVGELVVGDIGLPKTLRELKAVDLELATVDAVRALLPARPKDSHKGTYGRAMVIGGSINLPGAAVLAGEAAYRSGAGLVTLAVPTSIQGLLAPQLPEATWVLLPNEMGSVTEAAVDVLVNEMGATQSLVIGPGMGREDPAQTFIGRLLGLEAGGHRSKIGFLPMEEGGKTSHVQLPPCVIDADGLFHLSAFDGWWRKLPEDTVLTPHPGEMARLTGESKDELQKDRMGSAQAWAKEWGAIVVLKGAFTVVAALDGRAAVLPFATSALATAGTGDVLAGLIGGFRAQGVPGYEAAVLGGFVHGRAGEVAAELLGSEASVVAGDVLSAIPDAIESIRSGSMD